MRMIANYSKSGALRFTSHLDMQRLMQRALRRAGMPVAYSMGFNPHPQLSFASALALGYTSDAEWVDIKLNEHVEPETFVARMNAALPDGATILSASVAEGRSPALTALIERASYRVDMDFERPVDQQKIIKQIEDMLAGEIIVNKKTKGGWKDVDIRPQVLLMRLIGLEGQKATFEIEGVLDAYGSLQMELLLQAFTQRLGETAAWRVHRTSVHFRQLGV
ncbi:TIGR03936 family radical SAM-associated protein [Eubacteriales bacterium OttesenSCG-928-K08]|nr:TIGR03936 family radical SAM-associated protein [Eubacteriales bacterium OttesenSCG-928-K08]